MRLAFQQSRGTDTGFHSYHIGFYVGVNRILKPEAAAFEFEGCSTFVSPPPRPFPSSFFPRHAVARKISCPAACSQLLGTSVGSDGVGFHVLAQRHVMRFGTLQTQYPSTHLPPEVEIRASSRFHLS